MQNAQLKNILYRYANTKGVGTPLTAEEMLNAISSWLVDTLPECIDVNITSLPTTSAPTVTLTGSGTPDDHYVFSFGIPEGNSVTNVTISNGRFAFEMSDGTTVYSDYVIPTITIGSITTLPAGSQATAEIVGDPPNFTLNLGIPEGEKGESADEPNFTFDVTTLAAGSSATVNVSGTYPNLNISLGIPRGDTGATGATGADGKDADEPNFTFDVTTLAAGSTPTLEVTGEYPNLHLTFGIPLNLTLGSIEEVSTNLSEFVPETAGEYKIGFIWSLEGITDAPFNSRTMLVYSYRLFNTSLTYIQIVFQVNDAGDSLGIAIRSSYLGVIGDWNYIRGSSSSSGMVFMGTWVSGNTYQTDDVVTYGTSDNIIPYVCISDISGSSTTPDEDTEHWQALVNISTTPKYRHCIYISGLDTSMNSFVAVITFINDYADSYTTLSEIGAYLNTIAATYPANGYIANSQYNGTIWGVSYYTNGIHIHEGYNLTTALNEDVTISDVVTTL